jgi:hypothetical protein
LLLTGNALIEIEWICGESLTLKSFELSRWRGGLYGVGCYRAFIVPASAKDFAANLF